MSKKGSFDKTEVFDPSRTEAEQSSGKKKSIRVATAASVLPHAAEEKSAPQRKLRKAPAVYIPLLLLIIGLTVYAAAAGAHEYKTAVEFFEENRISTEKLTREEIRTVYRDITKKTYSSEKTLEILENYAVEFISEDPGTLSRDELDALWDKVTHRDELREGNTFAVGGGITYSVFWDSSEKEFVPGNTENGSVPLYTETGDGVSEVTEEPGIPDEVNSGGTYYPVKYLVKRQDGKEIWRVRLPHDEIDYADTDTLCECGENILVPGCVNGFGTWHENACVICFDKNGKKLWSYRDNTEGLSYTSAVTDGEKIWLLGSGAMDSGYKTLFTVLDLNGRELLNVPDAPENYLRYDASAKIGDRILVRIFTNGKWRLCAYSLTGERLDCYSYSEDGVMYEIRDIVSAGGLVFLSTDRPARTEEEFGNCFYQVMKDLSYKNSAANGEEPLQDDGRLLSLISEQHTAILLTVTENGTVERAYEVKNSKPGTLSTDENGNVIWQVLRIDRVTPADVYLNSRVLDIDETEFSLVFFPDGRFKEKTEVGYFADMY